MHNYALSAKIKQLLIPTWFTKAINQCKDWACKCTLSLAEHVYHTKSLYLTNHRRFRYGDNKRKND